MPRFHYLADKVDQEGDFMGVLTGEFRPPKAGEWYLSGAIPECYEARSDLITPYYIVRLARIVRETVIREIGIAYP